MKKLIVILFLLIASQSYAQCIQYQTEKGEECNNPNSVNIDIINNCSSEQYVMILVIGENHEVKKLFGGYLEPGEQKSNWTCHGSNVTVRYWAVDQNDRYEAYKSARAWYNDSRESKRIK